MNQLKLRVPALKTLPTGVGRVWLAVGAACLAVILAIVLILSREDWNFLRSPISRFATAKSGRVVRLDGNLRAHLLSFTPEVDIGGLKIGKPAWAGPGDMADVDLARLQVRLVPLLLGRVEMPLIELRGMRLDLLRDTSGRESWALNPGSGGKPVKLPLINRFIITDGRLRLADQIRKIVFTGAVQASEKPTSAGGRGFSLDGAGTLNSEAFQLQASGGPLIAVRYDRPYPFRMDVRAGATHALVAGQISRPFDLSGLEGSLTLSGPDMARLYELTGVTLPDTPPYRLSAQFQRQGARYHFSSISGTIGDTDLNGNLTLDRVRGRRTLTADLVSKRLNFPDLLSLLGGPPTRSAPSAAPASGPAQIKLPIGPKPAGGAQSSDHRLLPDAPLYEDRLRTMDADVRYRADSIKAGPFSVRRGSLALVLENGVLTLDPMDLDFTQGRLFGSVRIDAREPQVKTDLDLKAANVALGPLLGQTGPQPAIEGVLQARARLSGVGDSVHKAASTAHGEVVFLIPHGRIRQAFAELLGINAGRGLYLLLSKNDRQTDMRCAVAQFDVQGGVMTAQQFVIDTGVVTATGSGSINLGDERLALQIKGHTKHLALLRIWTPIEVGGTFDKPSIGVNAGSVAAQAGLAAGVSALLGPLTAILPFISPGLAKDADCAAFVASAKSAGAPVKASHPGPTQPKAAGRSGSFEPTTAPR